MISMTPDIAQLIAAFVAGMNEEIELLELKGAHLEALSTAILARDDEALPEVMRQMEQAQVLQDATDQKLLVIRSEIANVLAWPLELVTATKLAAQITGPNKTFVEQSRQRIIEIAGQVRKQHLETVLLLAECTKINRMLLEGLFGSQAQPLHTYGRSGHNTWRPDTGVVDAEL